jgi:hypothetical protein
VKSDQGNLIERSQERLAIDSFDRIFGCEGLEWSIAKNQGKKRAIHPLSIFRHFPPVVKMRAIYPLSSFPCCDLQNNCLCPPFFLQKCSRQIRRREIFVAK